MKRVLVLAAALLLCSLGFAQEAAPVADMPFIPLSGFGGLTYLDAGQTPTLAVFGAMSVTQIAS